jgi:pimeloyl-CoA dehydrogenase small subunit
MNFALSDDQRMLQDTVERLVARSYGFEQRKAYAAQPCGWSREVWRTLAEIGLLALPFPEAQGGLGGGPVDVMLVMQALGKALPLEPLLSTMVIGGAALRHASPAQLDRWVGAIAAGELTLGWAHREAQSRYRLHDVACSAQRVSGGWLLSGNKPLVLHGDSVDRLLLGARSGGARRDADGLSLFMVDAAATGVERRPCRTHDGRRAADIVLDRVHVADADLIGEPGHALPIIEAISEAAIAALAAEAVGVMDSALAMTVDYLKTRQQFGGPIARFQALQHRAAEMLIALEQSRSMAMYAALMLDEPDAAERRKALSAVKVQIGHAARFVGQQAIQLHGGIGVTEEYAVGHCHKRLAMMEMEFGDSDHHLAEFARAGGFVGARTGERA